VGAATLQLGRDPLRSPAQLGQPQHHHYILRYIPTGQTITLV
jgi:hypothetical protein